MGAANEGVDSIDRDELARFFSLGSDPEDEEAEKNKKKIETTRDQLTEALYQKGLALAEIEFIECEKASALASTDGTNDMPQAGDKSDVGSDIKPDLFEENLKELKKWVDLKSSKYGTLSVLRERRCGRLGTALKVLNDTIEDDGEPPKKKLYELKLSLLDEIGWSHLSNIWSNTHLHSHCSYFPKIFFNKRIEDLNIPVLLCAKKFQIEDSGLFYPGDSVTN
ncbi:hypothetical protein PTKIN_Ptkin05aG0110900 [Pterospermum kingtungense]